MENESKEESENRHNCLETHQSPKPFPGRSHMANPQNARGRSPSSSTQSSSTHPRLSATEPLLTNHLCPDLNRPHLPPLLLHCFLAIASPAASPDPTGPETAQREDSLSPPYLSAFFSTLNPGLGLADSGMGWEWLWDGGLFQEQRGRELRKGRQRSLQKNPYPYSSSPGEWLALGQAVSEQEVVAPRPTCPGL